MTHARPRTSLQQLCAEARQTQHAAFRPGTHKNHRTAWRRYLEFLDSYNIAHNHQEPIYYCAFLEYLAQEKLAIGTILNYSSSVRLLHTVCNWDCAYLDSIDVKHMKAGLVKSIRTIQEPKLYFTRDNLRRLIRALRGNPAQYVLAVVFSFAFYGLFRISNLCASSAGNFDKSRDLRFKDVHLAKPGLQIFINWSKARQSVTQASEVPLPETGDSTCPVFLWRRYIGSLSSTIRSGPALRLPNGAPLNHLFIRNNLRHACRVAGLGDNFVFKAFRRGGAVHCFQRGVPLEQIQRHGLWVSSSIYTYLSTARVTNNQLLEVFRKD